MDDKCRAPYSSSMLVVNSFARFRRTEMLPVAYDLAGLTRAKFRFEGTCPTGLGGTPPHLDVLACGSEVVLGVESKCTEHLGSKKPEFADSYLKLRDSNRQSPAWIIEMEAIRAIKRAYKHLDAAQLIKHALGISNNYFGKRLTLLYIYWEPTNANSIPEIRDHRAELQEFRARVRGGSPAFHAMTYDDLWKRWEREASPAWLRAHVARLRERYDVAI